MSITIREVDASMVRSVKQYGSTFEVTSKLVLHAENGKISYTVVAVPPYRKQYGPEEVEPHTYVGSSDKIVFFAFVDEKLAGQIRLWKQWNNYAYIDDIAVEPDYRGQGVGYALIQRAIAWAKLKGLPGIMLETQDNNVAACRLYERCGFELCGFDTQLYKGVDPATDEIALYWYLIFYRNHAGRVGQAFFLPVSRPPIIGSNYVTYGSRYALQDHSGYSTND